MERKPQTSVPDWSSRVDQADRAALAHFISSFPNAKSATIEELRSVREGCIELAHFCGLTVVLDRRGFAVDLELRDSECYYSVGGTHAAYGNFALFWSCRGPGDGAAPRPCFLFWDGEAEFLKSAEAA